MIEWIPIKEFLDQVKDEKEYFLILDRGKNVMTTSVSTHPHSTILEVYTHAAKINFPVEKTLEEKFKEYHLSKVGWSSQDRDVYKGLAEIAKQHYEGEK